MGHVHSTACLCRREVIRLNKLQRGYKVFTSFCCFFFFSSILEMRGISAVVARSSSCLGHHTVKANGLYLNLYLLNSYSSVMLPINLLILPRPVYLVHICSSCPHWSSLRQHPVLQNLTDLSWRHLAALQPPFGRGKANYWAEGTVLRFLRASGIEGLVKLKSLKSLAWT